MTLQISPFKHYVAGRDRPNASDLNARGDLLSKLARSLAANGVVDSTGILTRPIRRPPSAGTISIKIFEVQSEATGDGVYNCYEQTLDATEWDDEAGDNKFDDKNETSVEVFNLAEFDPEATYVAHLAANDLIVAWQKVDDENTSRWIGLPLRQANADRPRLAYCKTDAGAGATIVCYLDTDASGSEITVNCSIMNGTNLNESLPRLVDGKWIMVTKVGANWYCIAPFQGSEDCDCYTE